MRIEFKAHLGLIIHNLLVLDRFKALCLPAY
jgi:hypothetical protein